MSGTYASRPYCVFTCRARGSGPGGISTAHLSHRLALPHYGCVDRVYLETAEDLRAELDRWRGLVDHLPALVSFWDAETRNVVANGAYLEWLGLKPSQLHGMRLRDVLGEELHARN